MIQRITNAFKLEVQDDVLHVPHLKKIVLKAQDQLAVFANLVPSDGFITMTIKSAEDGCKVIMSLASGSLKFLIDSVDQNPVKAFEQVMEEATKNIDEWKRQRTFKEEAI